MKTLALFALLSVGCVAVGDSGSEIDMSFDQPTEQHAWLQQLVGEWDVRSEATMGAETMVVEGTETVATFGDLWIVSDGVMDFGGMEVAARMTLGYDPAKEFFGGTWVGSVHDDLWVYRGQLDHGRKVLVLETEGPHFSDPRERARYRDTIEILGPDRRRMVSTMEGLDGNWATFMTAEYTRRSGS